MISFIFSAGLLLTNTICDTQLLVEIGKVGSDSSVTQTQFNEALLKMRLRRQWAESSVRVSGEDIHYNLLLGGGTSRVFLNNDRNQVIKLIPASLKYKAELEVLTTEYALENNKEVPRILKGPEEVLVDGEPMVVIVREYFAGFTERELFQKEFKSLGFDLTHLTIHLDEIKNEMGALFANARFENWLKTKKGIVDPEKKFGGDLDEATSSVRNSANYVYTYDGWRLLDP